MRRNLHNLSCFVNCISVKPSASGFKTSVLLRLLFSCSKCYLFPQLLRKKLFAIPLPSQISLHGMIPKPHPLDVRAREACAWIGMDAQHKAAWHSYSCQHKASGGGVLPAAAQLQNPSFANCTWHARQSVNESWSRLTSYMQCVLSWSIGEAGISGEWRGKS